MVSCRPWAYTSCVLIATSETAACAGRLRWCAGMRSRRYRSYWQLGRSVGVNVDVTMPMGAGRPLVDWSD